MQRPPPPPTSHRKTNPQLVPMQKTIQSRIQGLQPRLEHGFWGSLEPSAKLSKNAGRSHQSGKEQLEIAFVLKGVSDSWFLCIKLSHPQCSSGSPKVSEVAKLSKQVLIHLCTAPKLNIQIYLLR